MSWVIADLGPGDKGLVYLLWPKVVWTFSRTEATEFNTETEAKEALIVLALTDQDYLEKARAVRL